MRAIPMVNCIEDTASLATLRTSTIRCYAYPSLTGIASPPRLPIDQELTVEAMALLMRIDSGVRDARADWNEDRFRRLMRLRPSAVRRLRRRWERLNPKPRIPLGNLRRRYHSNVAGYLFS